MGASYNPRTGTYARGAAAYGPGGARGAAQAYNPRTGTYAQTRQGSNVYGNWGTSSVQRGDNWAQTAHRTNYGPGGSTTSGIRTSNGGAAVNRSGAAGSTTVGRTAGGDVYAGHDGNVYRRTEGGGWEQSNGSGGWSPAEGGNRPTPTGEGNRGAQAGTTGTRDRVPSDRSPSATPQTNQLERDRGARSEGNTRTTTRSSWESSGSSRSGAGSYRGGGGRAGGGGRRR